MPAKHSASGMRYVWLIAAALVIGIFVIVTKVWSNLPTPQISPPFFPTTEPSAEPAEALPDSSLPHKSVYIRQGIISELGVDYLTLETKRLVGEGKESIQILLTGDTQIIEIQIPSFMTAELKKILAKGGSVITRLEVDMNNLYVGQTVEVVSESDMYGLSDVSAERVEYKVEVNTEDGAQP